MTNPDKPDLLHLARTSFEELQKWAGKPVARRGWEYQAEERVSSVARTEAGDLLTWVDGTRRYATRVGLDDRGVLRSVCTCPYDGECKHAVASILEYVALTEGGTEVPTARRNDVRLRLCGDDARDDDLDVEFPVSPVEPDAPLAGFLESRTPEQLRALLGELAEAVPAAASHLDALVLRENHDIAALQDAVAREIERLCDGTDWWDRYEREWNGPDFDHLRQLMKSLIQAGGEDELAGMGEPFLQRLSELMAGHQYADDLLGGAEGCVRLVLEAVKKSSWSPAERLIWALDVTIDDEYNLADVVGEYLEVRHARESWNIAAEHLLDRLDEMPVVLSRRDFSGQFARRSLVQLVAMTLERAGRAAEITELLEAEARESGLWELLIDNLIAAGRDVDAEERIVSALADIGEAQQGTAARLRRQWREIRARAGDWRAVGAMETVEFLQAPSVKAFEACREVAETAGCWDRVRPALLASLETGTLPWRQTDWPWGPPQSPEAFAGWARSGAYPWCDVLIDLAIHERDPRRVLHWYDSLSSSSRAALDTAERVAAAVCDHAPERAVALWQELAEAHIRRTKPAAYRSAGHFLRRAGQVMYRTGRVEAWLRYLSSLRERHRRKRRLLEVLDGLSGGRS